MDVEQATLNNQLLKLRSEEKLFGEVMDTLAKEIASLDTTGELIGMLDYLPCPSHPQFF